MEVIMKHFTTPEYADPLKTERYYMNFCSHHDHLVECMLKVIIILSALIALATLIAEIVR